jgi:hypothetical protein
MKESPDKRKRYPLYCTECKRMPDNGAPQSRTPDLTTEPSGDFSRRGNRFLKEGQPTEPAPIALRDLPPITTSQAEQILARSRNGRGRPPEAVEASWSGFSPPR